MAKKKAPPKLEDEAQSKRFLETVRDMQDAGDLDPAEAEKAFERTIRTALHPKKAPPSQGGA